MARKPESINWSRIEYLRSKSFHGSPLSEQETKEVTRAYEEDPDRYTQIGNKIRDEYKRSLCV